VKNKSQSGFSLVEMVVAVGLMALLLGGALRWQSILMQQEIGEKEADGMAQFQYFVSAYFMQNRDAMLEAMWDGTDAAKHCRVGATAYDSATDTFTGGSTARSATLKTCAIDERFLSYKGFWTGAVAGAADPRYVAIFKRRSDTSTDAEAFIAKMSPSGALSQVSNIDRALAMQGKLGSRAGYMPIGAAGPCVSTKTTPQACGASWTVNLADFIDSAQLSTVKTVLPN
jgi:prepilin-type N-terminal cleavage/methylation domain-containing protein